MAKDGDVSRDRSIVRGDTTLDARAGVVARMRARRDELVREIFARVQSDAFGLVGAQDTEYVAGLRAAVVAAVDYVLDGIERGEDDGSPPTPIPVVAAEQARRAARVGVPLDTVLRRYLVGHTLFEQSVMDEADRSGLPDEREALRGALRAQAAVLDRLLERIAQEYGEELERIGRSPEQRRAERVRGLLEGGTLEDREVEDRGVEGRGAQGRAGAGAGLDYEIEGRWHLGAIAVGVGAAQAVRELAMRADRRLLSVAQGGETRGGESVWAWLGSGERFAVGEIERAIAGVDGLGTHPPRPPEGVVLPEGALPEGVVLALGEPARGLQGWRSTHRQAQAALVVALRRPRNGVPPTQGVTRYADVALLATALKDELLGRSLVEIYLAPLEDARDGGTVLRETLRVYLRAERSASSAAIVLGVSRTTVINRLRTIEAKLGRTLHTCPAELEVALELSELASPQPQEISNGG